MAVDYVHRLIVTGSPVDVKQFAADMRRTVTHGPVGKVRAWREHVPLSFDAMWERCPALRRVHDVSPYDPYELAVWPLEHLRDGRARKRYRFQTRSMDAFPMVRVVSRYYPRLAFVLVTLCLDGGEFTGYFCWRGRMRQRVPSEARQDAHWKRAMEQLGITGEIPYWDDEVRFEAEQGIWEETRRSWDKAVDAATLPARGRCRNEAGKRPDAQVSWWERPQRRPLFPDRSALILEMAEHNPKVRKRLGL